MKCDLPILLKCCFCVPLRIGLLVWVYIKLVICFVTILSRVLQVHQLHDELQSAVGVYVVLSLVVNIIDFGFQIVFIVSAHKKMYKIMRIYCIYTAVYLFVPILAFIIFFSILFSQISGFALLFLFSFSPFSITVMYLPIELILNVYFILMVRSEFIKLKNAGQFQFFNHESEARCTAVLDAINVIDNGKSNGTQEKDTILSY